MSHPIGIYKYKYVPKGDGCMTDELTLPTLKCLRCSHTWYPRNPRLPKVCPSCKSPYWNKEREKRWAIEKAKGTKGKKVKEVTWEGNPTALHEAGHAVFAYASGFLRPTHIEITPDGQGFVDCNDPPDKESLNTGPVIIRRMELHYSHKLAGEAAQEIAGIPEADRSNLVMDSPEAGELLKFLADHSDEGREALHDRARARAKELLTRHWDVVVDLAKGVEIRWSLSGNELEGFLESRLGPFTLSK
jgi:ATP-dependent Zn protease